MSVSATAGVIAGAKSPDLSVLLSARGATLFFDSTFGVTAASNLVTAWSSRIGSEAVTAAGADRPAYNSVLSGSKSGVTFDGVATKMASLTSALPAAVQGSAAYSALFVAKTAGGAQRAVWSCGNSVLAEYIGEGCTTAADWRIRRTVAAASLANTGSQNPGTSVQTFTTVYSGSAYSTWVARTASLAASANSRAPICTHLGIGYLQSGGTPAFFFDGTIWGVIVAPGVQWTTQERQRYELAAKAYWTTT